MMYEDFLGADRIARGRALALYTKPSISAS
jgi:hypothetical protein